MSEISQPSDIELLDTYSEDGLAHEPERVDALATISAGYRDDRNRPQRSQDGTIYLHDPEGRAPNLAAILKDSPNLLTIALPFDDLERAVQQRFVRYSASRLEVYGDAEGLTEIKVAKAASPTAPERVERIYHPRGSDGYKRLLPTCKVSCSVYFALARWLSEEESEVYFPDGLALYRLRFTSRNSLRNLRGNLRMIAAFTGGRIAGVPLDLQLVYRETSDPTGARRKVPVWTLAMRPPFTLSTRTVRKALLSGLRAAEEMMVPLLESLPQATLEEAASDAQLPDDEDAVSERDLKQLSTGDRFESLTSTFFASVRGTLLEDDDARHAWLSRITNGEYESLKEMLESSENPSETLSWLLEQARREVSKVEREADRASNEAKQREADADIKAYDERKGVTPQMVEYLSKLMERLEARGLPYRDRLDFLSWSLNKNVDTWLVSNRDLEASDIVQLKREFSQRSPEDVDIYVQTFREWLASDAANELLAQVVLR